MDLFSGHRCIPLADSGNTCADRPFVPALPDDLVGSTRRRLSFRGGDIGASRRGAPDQNTRFWLFQPPALGLLTPVMVPA
jgi:hypothetical protein